MRNRKIPYLISVCLLLLPAIFNPVGIGLLHSQTPGDSVDVLITITKFPGGEKREYEHKTVYVFSKDEPRYEWNAVYDSLTGLGPFPGLAKMDFDGGVIYYNAGMVEPINKLHMDLDPGDPLLDSTSAMADQPVLFRSPLAPDSVDKFIFAFDWGPSDDPCFIIYRGDNSSHILAAMGGTRMYVPGDGYVYLEGHTNNSFNHRKKFRYRDGKFEEAKQAAYYVGLQTYITAPMKLYKDTTYTEAVASLAENQPVEVVIADFKEISGDGHDYLIRTPFGLTGWVRLYYTYPRTNVVGIYMAGD